MTSTGAGSLATAIPHLLRRRRPSISSPALSLNPLLFGSRVTAAPPLSSQRRRGHWLPLSASRQRRGRQSGAEDEDDASVEGAEEEEEVEDGDEAAMPFQEMRQWLRNKPAGFGEGRAYDTRLEDELWEEMERSRKVLLASANKLKNEPAKSDGTAKAKQEPLLKAADEVPCGFRVRVRNLPRKKNIHRDLQRAFQGFPDLVSISPAVIGNQKTREPICKGFAFVDFASEEAASRFVQVYSRRSVCFGKVEKQIACDVISPHGTSNSSEQCDDDALGFTQPNSREAGDMITSDVQERAFDDVAVGTKVIDESEAATSPKRKKESLLTHFEEREHLNIPVTDNVDNESKTMIKTSGLNNSVPPMQKQQKKTSSKKKAVKTYLVKASKPSLPGSVARLKIKEKTILTGVFSKYGRKVASGS
ncbi:unnamed protein product [Musa acuminata subsp. malaccensis]|uniref:(wild Malaysian banana) hypothetical protein n=1 Tax=Musa acuminata subsp. malaccensis TaxID=214687 RepID=A0A804HS24_MUSAM|nr:PREDICTED: DNA polymerase epsilon subunit C isoform X1 [Musa acuminata subsp. malaccensis]CAG1859013.1 unnamed protein product [Musa acuminata subsp. malaccensis]